MKAKHLAWLALSLALALVGCSRESHETPPPSEPPPVIEPAPPDDGNPTDADSARSDSVGHRGHGKGHR